MPGEMLIHGMARGFLIHEMPRELLIYGMQRELFLQGMPKPLINNPPGNSRIAWLIVDQWNARGIVSSIVSSWNALNMFESWNAYRDCLFVGTLEDC